MGFKSATEKNIFCYTPAQVSSLQCTILLFLTCIFFSYVIENDIASGRLDTRSRFVYVCPFFTAVAGIIAIAAFFLRITWLYGIGAQLNGLGLMCWILFLIWITISRTAVSVFTIIIAVAFQIIPSTVFELALCFAYIDQKNEESKLPSGIVMVPKYNYASKSSQSPKMEN
ncbi:hypothetical protein Ddc_11812 [Ditylenchus destructor]|nr:hypothetical protein Ddc_11812 [Ditylenchus destructor]